MCIRGSVGKTEKYQFHNRAIKTNKAILGELLQLLGVCAKVLWCTHVNPASMLSISFSISRYWDSSCTYSTYMYFWDHHQRILQNKNQLLFGRLFPIHLFYILIVNPVNGKPLVCSSRTECVWKCSQCKPGANNSKLAQPIKRSYSFEA